jgi:regulator of sigma E protease
MLTFVLFVLILTLLVFVHEFGHFIMARKMGMRVYEFAIGFPPFAIGCYRDPKTGKLVWVKGKKKVKRNVLDAGGGSEVDEHAEYPNTLYSLNYLPLGGFCKIKGENGEEAQEKDSFGAQKAWKRIVVLVAGVVMNFLLAGVLLGIGFMIGLPADVTGVQDNSAQIVQNSRVVIQQVEHDSAAEKAGLQFGDTLLSLDGQPVPRSSDVIAYTKSHIDKDISVKILRGSEEKTITIHPTVVKSGESARLGVLLADAGLIKYPWYIAIYKGFVAAFWGLIGIFVGFYGIIKGLILGNGVTADVSGPVGIASVIGQSARLGISYLINVAAMISLSLAALNILPFPALDGGRVLFVVLEKIFRRPVPQKYEQIAHTIGFVLLLILIVIVTGRDIKGLF